MTKHKHAEVIKAWADGAEIQAYINPDYGWQTVLMPTWAPDIQFRIKPKEPEPVVKYINVYEKHCAAYVYNTIQGAFSAQTAACTYCLKIVTYPNGTREFSVV